MEFGVCMMMLVFMTLFDSLLCIDCRCIVGLLSTMTSVAKLGSSFVPPTSLYFVLIPNLLEDVKKEVQGNTDSNSKDLQASATVDK